MGENVCYRLEGWRRHACSTHVHRVAGNAEAARTLERSPGHYHEFVSACRGGPAPGANFVDHAGVVTETCLLGNVALRSGLKLTWDGPACKVTSDESANKLLQRDYREGWSL